MHDPGNTLTEAQIQQHFDNFYEDFYCELAKFGQLEEMHVCDNVGDHLIGNVYARYELEEDAQKAVDTLNARFYAGLPVYAELSPVTDFREACCRQHESKECTRGGFCNFMHLKEVTPALKKELEMSQRLERRLGRRMNGERSRSATPKSDRSQSPPRDRRNGGDDRKAPRDSRDDRGGFDDRRRDRAPRDPRRGHDDYHTRVNDFA